MYKELGFVRVGALVPKLKVANVLYNVDEIIKNLKEMEKKGVSIVTTPELSLCGYTCEDLFFQDTLIKECMEGIKKIQEVSKNMDIVIIIGTPIKHNNKLFNCAVVIEKGKILGIVPKTNITNYSNIYEKRWFASSKDSKDGVIVLFGEEILFSTNILFQDKEKENICFAIEIGDDLSSPFAPSTNHALGGATIIFNLSASNEVIGNYQYRQDLIKIQSAKTLNSYVYASSGVHESTTDLVFSGHALICENGEVLNENERFDLESNFIISDIDVDRLVNNRIKNTGFINGENVLYYKRARISVVDKIKHLDRKYDRYPFIPKNEKEQHERCREILNIQACGLVKRLLHTNIKKTVIGISGGLDSTLAFLVIVDAYKKLGISNDNIIAVTLPGFGTTDRTYQNALELIKLYGATLKEVDIKNACLVHNKDIGLSSDDLSVTFENAQARERTKILMDIAGLVGGIVIGTGDLSELALGWCTYNGDHMSMYSVNSSIPKTLVKYLVKWCADNDTSLEIKRVLYDILSTPISPELLPPNKVGKIKQKTEEIVGPYALHDFFLYHFYLYGASLYKIYTLAKASFKDEYSAEEIKKWLIKFTQRFFGQQFKRNCMPDGVGVGTIGLSPRVSFKMASDADASIWLEKLEKDVKKYES